MDTATLGDTAFVTLEGEWDLASCELVRSAVREAAHAAGGPVVIDLSGIEFIDLSGLRVLEAAATRLGGRLKILPAPEPANRLFEVTGTVDRLPFVS